MKLAAGVIAGPLIEEQKYRKLDFMWSRLKGSCGDAINCVGVTLKATKKMVEISDERDVLLVKASQRLAAVPSWQNYFSLTLMP
jgi:hypothetical protein